MNRQAVYSFAGKARELLPDIEAELERSGMKMMVDHASQRLRGEHSIILDSGTGVIRIDDVMIRAWGKGNVVNIYCDGKYVGYIRGGDIRKLGGGQRRSRPVEITDEEKRWMGEMMQGMGMIERDRHTLD